MSSIRGTFISGARSNNQTLYTAIQYDFQRSSAEGPHIFLAVYDEGQLELFGSEYAEIALRPVSLASDEPQAILVVAQGGGQGEMRTYARVISIARKDEKVLADIGIVGDDTCATGYPTAKNVAAKVSFRTLGNAIEVLPMDHFRQGCAKGGPASGPFKFLVTSRDGSDTVALQR